MASSQVGKNTADDTVSPDELRERKIIERFLGVLEKNPRRGTALDRVYGHHVERGTLDKFVQSYAERAKKNPRDGLAWMILGLIEAQRGKDAAAVAAFRQAETYLPKEPMASYYLGQSLVLIGQPDAAAEAFERAINRKPNRPDMLEVFQALGRVHQRAQRAEQALAVWNRLEKLFPDDQRVQEQIAGTLAEEGQYEQALARFTSLSKAVKDRYRQALFHMESAELKVRLGKVPDALAEYELLFSQLNPDSWLYREVRRKIEEVFLRNDDLAGLCKYYESWIGKNAEDLDAMARLARHLAAQGRVPEAQVWLSKALKLAPSRKEIRLAFIEQLVMDQKYDQAAKQYEDLNKTDPNNPDYLREWGRLLLKDKSRPEAERKPAAIAVWRKLTEARPKDPVIATQVADLFRQAEMTDEALALYKHAIELAPDGAQYREYLGEYYHSLKRSEEALNTWREIAAGKNRNAKSLTRLGEVLAGFGYVKEATQTLGEACKLDTDDFNLRYKYADLLHQCERYPDALKELALAEKLASNLEEAEGVLEQQIKNFQAAQELLNQIETLQKELKTNAKATADRWYRFARYLEAARQLPEATAAIQKALEAPPGPPIGKSSDGGLIRNWTAAARIHEAGGNLLAAADANRKLAAIDRRYRTEYLTNVAKLEAKLGRKEQALAAGRDLLAAAPNNPEHYQFFASLCFQLGENEDGFEALRRSVRVNPDDPKVIMSLAGALAERLRTDEAIELYWRAFEKSKELEGKLGIVGSLTEQYLQINHFERLTERLERERREEGKQREMTICLAQAYQSAGDHGTARLQLERLLAENARDSQLLNQLAVLAENEGDTAAAVKYQQQLVRISPSKEAELKLAQLLTRAGEPDEASSIWVRLAASEPDPQKVVQSIDSLMNNAKYDTALAVTERLLRDQPSNWEALYREGYALASMDKRAESEKRFHALLKVNLRDDEQSVLVKARKKGQPPGRLASVSRHQAQVDQTFPLQDRFNATWQVRVACRLEQQYYYYGSQQAFWPPADFGQARMAALGWLFHFANNAKKDAEFLNELKAGQSKPGQMQRAQWDLCYLQLVRQEQKESYEIAKTLAKSNDIAALWLYLSTLSSRGAGRGPRVVNSNNPNVDNTPPLPTEELEQVLAYFRSLLRRKPEWVNAGILGNVGAELKRAKRTKEEQQLYRDAATAAIQPENIQSVLSLAATRGNVDEVLTLFDKLEKSIDKKTARSFNVLQEASNSLAQTMKVRAEAKNYADILRLWDRYLESLVRRKLSATPGKSSVAGNPYGANYYQIMSGPYYRHVAVDYPTPNEYYDYSAIQLLRNAYEFYRKDDLVTDLVKHFQSKLAQSKDTERVFHLLALAYINWWSDDKDETVRQLNQVAGMIPADVNFQFELASIHEQRNEPEEALAILDRLNPVDHSTMQKREQSALKLAVMTGNIERARVAADRLFGLRLDAETQVQLTAQMRQLGMHELAEAVLARAGRQAGNRTAALVSLMVQYQSQGKNDFAVQIAHQLLRRGPSPQFNPGGGQSHEDSIRDQAMQVLARSGKLDELIQRTDAQLKNSPKSMRLYQALADYYRAAGNRDKTREMFEQMAKLQPDNAKLRYQIGQRMMEAGENLPALEHISAAIKKDPSLFAHNYWQIQQTYQQANKLDDLVQILDGADFKQMGNYWQVMNVVQSLLQDAKMRDKGMKLFKKAWNAYPTQRSELLSNLYNEEIWRMPEMYDYAREAVIPADSATQIDAWNAVNHILYWSGDGKVMGVVTRFLEAATRQNKADALAREVEAALKKFPEWSSGKAIMTMVNAKRGKMDEANRLLKEINDDKKNPMPLYARWVVGQELEDYGPLQTQVLRLYEDGLNDATADQNMDYSYNPMRRLVMMYQRMGRVQDARNLVLKFSKTDRNQNYYDPEYEAYRYINNMNSIGDQLLQLGYPVDAVRIYNDVLSDERRLVTASRWGGDHYKNQAQRGLTSALESLKPETLPAALRELMKPRGNSKSAGPVVDLAVIVSPRIVQTAELTSMLARTLRSVAGHKELHKEMHATMAELLKKHPSDLSVHIADALVALLDKDPAIHEKAVNRLRDMLAKTPLESLPKGGRANARQRNEAMPHVALWLVARECEKSEKLRAAGEIFAERALEAADRQADNYFALAILREWGQMALQRGDRKTAESRWTRMLNLVLPKTDNVKISTKSEQAPVEKALAMEQVKTLVASADDKPPAAAAPAPPKKPVDKKRAALPVIMLDRFNQAMEIAKLAAKSKMNDLSLRCVRDSLRAGPPIFVQQVDDSMRSRYMYSGVAPPITGQSVDPANRAVFEAVEQRLQELDALWRQQKFSPLSIYETIASVVLPDLRPEEIFLYPRPLTSSGLQRPRSVGKLLTDWAIKAERNAPARQRIEARQRHAMAELSAHVLLAQLGLASQDKKLCTEQFSWLGQRLQKDTLQNTAELVCHAVLPALYQVELNQQALPLIEKAAKNLGSSSGEEPAGSLLLVLARYHFEHKNIAEGRKQLQQYKDMLMRTAVRSGGYAQIQQMQRVAAEFVRAGLVNDVLEMFGQYADFAPLIRRNYGSLPGLGSMAAAFARQFAATSADKQYEMLKAWTLPTLLRRSVRLVSTFAPSDVPPAVFVQLPATPPPVVSSGAMLIDAAKKTGKLDELEKELQKAVDSKMEDARALLLLTQLAKGDSAKVEAELKKILEERRKEMPAQGDRTKPLQWSDFLLARAAAADPKLRATGISWGENMITHAQRTQNWPFLAQSRRFVHEGYVAREKATGTGPGIDPGFALWHPASHVSALSHANGGPPAWWVAHEGHICHITGPEQDFLYFDYPLNGAFEFSVDGFDGGWAESHVGYGGLVFEPNIPGIGSSMWRVGKHENIPRVSRFNRRGEFDRLTIQVQPGKVRYVVNGHLFFEDTEPSPTSPWLALYGTGNRKSIWRNFTLTGSPQIPREVSLTHADRLEGWISSFYGETQLNRVRKLPKPAKEQQQQQQTDNQPEPNPDDFDWSARDGVILGRRSESTAQFDAIQSRMFYHRPMRNGESVRYEFYYEPDAVLVHPALDRLTFLLEPNGVKLHWMTDGPTNEWTGLKTDNQAEEPGNRRGSPRLPLKSGQWNSMKIMLADNKVALQLNGDLIYERPLEAANDRLFGFFHYKDRTAVQVRNVVLSGDWPQNLTPAQNADLLALVHSNIPPAERRARHQLMAERVFSRNVDNVVKEARRMPTKERYAYLSRWVLPNDDHRPFRLYAEFLPNSSGQGSLQAPAIDLVAAAKELGMLDDLKERVRKAAAPANLEKRNQTALLTLIAIAQENDKEAEAFLTELKPLLDKVPATNGVPTRWPELVAASNALSRPRLARAAMPLLEKMVLQVQEMGAKNVNAEGRADWERMLRHERARAQVAALPDSQRTPFGERQPLAFWTPVTHVRAETHGGSYPAAHWTTHQGELKHYPGHSHDYMYLNMPLRGNFEVECELTSFGWRETQLNYAGIRPYLVYDLKRVNVEHFNQVRRTVPLEPPLAKVGDWYKYKLVVKDGSYSAYVGDRQIFEDRLPNDPDPWLAVHALANMTGGARNLKINGTPTIPEVVSMSHLPDLTGWLPDYYGDSVEWTNVGQMQRSNSETPAAAWTKRGEEINGRLFPENPGSKQESILQYHRPLSEDGELEFEFFYEKDKAMTHLALDRVVFLLEPDGVKIHMLTDAQFDRTGLSPDNVAIEKKDRRGPEKLPLQSPGWNRVKLKLSGDKATIALNGVEIYERVMDKGSQRILGFFHYADETEVRVRNVKYRGNWPKQLPALAELLATVKVTAQGGKK